MDVGIFYYAHRYLRHFGYRPIWLIADFCRRKLGRKCTEADVTEELERLAAENLVARCDDGPVWRLITRLERAKAIRAARLAAKVQS